MQAEETAPASTAVISTRSLALLAWAPIPGAGAGRRPPCTGDPGVSKQTGARLWRLRGAAQTHPALVSLLFNLFLFSFHTGFRW